jgi:class 3 adenylate cyclase/predicted ATPase
MLGALADADRRIITVLFADLSGFTPLTEQLDAEHVRQLIAGCLNPLCDSVTRWGGHVDKFIGDCVMALFGAPVAYENEEERAIRAALDMHDALERWSEHGGMGSSSAYPKFGLKVGISTGPVVTGAFAGGGAHNYTAIGDAVNVAARLQGLCEPGQILVGPKTYELTRHIFEYGDERALQVKGKQKPVRAHAVLGVRARRAPQRGVGGRLTPLVGREGEMSNLEAGWTAPAGEGVRHRLIIGAPGIGKSRLAHEFLSKHEIAEEEVAVGRCYPYARSTPWEPMSELLCDLYDVPAGLDPTEATATVVERAPGSWSPGTASALSVALGAPVTESHALAGYDPRERQERIAEVVARALREGAGRARVLVLEDLQWADHATLEFLASLPTRELDDSVFFLLTARSPLPGEEYLDILHRGLEHSVELAPLSHADSGMLIEAALGKHRLPREFVELIIERTEGNPLFVEEMLKTLVGLDVIRRDDGCWRATAGLREVHVPDNVESLLSTRLDGLEPRTKRVVQCAAIVGRRFWSGVLADALVGRQVDSELDELVASEMFRPRSESFILGDREYMFENRLLQEVAYRGLLRELRAELHGAAAGWLEERLKDQSAESDDLIAFHHERSTEPARAVPFLERRAERARGRGALSDALDLARRALRLSPPETTPASLLYLAEEIAGESGEAEFRLQAIERLEATRGADDPEVKAEARSRRARYLLSVGELAAAKDAGEEALELSRRLGNRSRQGHVHSLLGRVAHLWGDYPVARDHYQASLELQRESGDRRGEAEILDRLGLVEVDIDDFCRSLDFFDQAMALAEELGDRTLEVKVLSHRATALRWLGSYEEAGEAARQALELALGSGSRRLRSTAQMTLGFVLAGAGREVEARQTLTDALELAGEIERPALEARIWLELAGLVGDEEAIRCARRARELAAKTGLVHVDILGQTIEADLALADGDLSAADEASAEAVDKLRVHGSVQGQEELVLFVRSRILDALDRADEAAAFAQEARELVEGKAAWITDPDLRASFLEGVSPNPEILSVERREALTPEPVDPEIVERVP